MALHSKRLGPEKYPTHGNLFAFSASNSSVVQFHRTERSHYARTSTIAHVATSDAELVRRARGRDEAAIRSIMQSNNRRLYRLARGILRNDGEAEDVVQETYVWAFTHLDSFRGDSSLATWLARIALNEALGLLRRQRPEVEWTSLPPGVLEAQIIRFPLSAPSEDPEQSMAQREIQRVVEHAIEDLPERKLRPASAQDSAARRTGFNPMFPYGASASAGRNRSGQRLAGGASGHARLVECRILRIEFVF
jgi:RNA polymerase sigma factor (sigma-70 family)